MIRFHTQTGGVTLQAQQPEVNIIRVALQGFAAVRRRHPVAPHQRLRRGARPADRALGPDRAAHPAGARPRVGRRRHRRPLRRLLLRRVAHRRGRGALLGADEEGRGPRRLGERARVHPEGDRGVGDLLPGALPDAARTSSSASTSTSPTRSTTSTSSGSIPRPRGASSRASRSGRRTATTRTSPSGSRSCARPPAATPTCCRRSRRRCASAARSARSATRCATSSASTAAARSSRPLRPPPEARGPARRSAWAPP